MVVEIEQKVKKLNWLLMQKFVLICFFQDGFAPPEEVEGDGLAQDEEEEY